MKKINKTTVLSAALVAVILAGAHSFSSAYRGDDSQKGPNYSEERHEAMEKAFESNDYEAWKALMKENSRGRILDVITEDNFPILVQIHELREEGKYEEANQLRAELGLGLRNGKGKGFRHSGGQRNFVDSDGDGICDNKDGQ